MKDMLSKEHYCYKIHTSLMESSAPPSIDSPLYGLIPPPPHFYKKILQGLIQAIFFVDVLILGTFILGTQSKKENSMYKEESQARFTFYHFKSILSLKAYIEWWLLGLLPQIFCLADSQQPPYSQFQRRKIDLLFF